MMKIATLMLTSLEETRFAGLEMGIYTLVTTNSTIMVEETTGIGIKMSIMKMIWKVGSGSIKDTASFKRNPSPI